MTISSKPYLELPGHSVAEEIDPELATILEDALLGFMTGDITSVNEQVLCEPKDGDEILDPELEAILDDAMVDFLCVDGMNALHVM